MSRTEAGEAALSIATCLAEISTRMTDAAAVAKAARTCAEAGSEREALRIAMDLDEMLAEVATLHGAMRFIGRMHRQRAAPPDD